MIESVSHNKLKALALFIIQSSNNNHHYDNATKFSMTPNKSHPTDGGKKFFIFTTTKAEFTNIHSICSSISIEKIDHEGPVPSHLGLEQLMFGRGIY